MPISNAELSKRIDALLAGTIGAKIEQEIGIVATQGTALLIDRVSETGKDANGQSFKAYSERYEQIKRFGVSGIQKEGAKKRFQRKTGKASGQNPIGRFTGFRNFTLTGQMLSSIGIIEQRQQGGSFVVRVGGRDDETRNKMIGNDNITPGWFTLAQKEIGQIASDSSQRFAQFIQNELEG